MAYASSKQSIRNALPGIAADVRVYSDDEIEYDAILKDITGRET